jgi:hypothetical protein
MTLHVQYITILFFIIPGTVPDFHDYDPFSAKESTKRCTHVRHRGVNVMECYKLGLEEIPQNLRTDTQVCFSSKLKFVGCCGHGCEAFRTMYFHTMKSGHTTNLQQLKKTELFTWDKLIIINKPDMKTAYLLNCLSMT